jgi:hypothetical protein
MASGRITLRSSSHPRGYLYPMPPSFTILQSYAYALLGIDASDLLILNDHNNTMKTTTTTTTTMTTTTDHLKSLKPIRILLEDAEITEDSFALLRDRDVLTVLDNDSIETSIRKTMNSVVQVSKEKLDRSL